MYARSWVVPGCPVVNFSEGSFMQKKILVAAIAAFAAAPVFADLTIYGTADVGYEYIDVGVDVNGNSLSSSRFTSGVLSTSAFGIKGEQKIDNGLKVGFQLESGFLFERGLFTRPSTNVNQSVAIRGASAVSMWNRISRVYLATKYGEFSFGRQYTPLAYVDCNLDPVCGGTAFSVDTYWAYPSRMDNSVKFTTSDKRGFVAQVSYSSGDQNMTKDDYTDPNKPVSGGVSYGASAQYMVGPTYIGFGYEQHYANSTNLPLFVRPTKFTGYIFGASYSFGKVKGFASFRNQKATLYPAGKVESNGFNRDILTIGASVLLGRGTFVTNFSFLSDKTDYLALGRLNPGALPNFDSRLFGLAYLYQLSKDVTVYVSGAKMDNSINGKANYTIVSGTLTGPFLPKPGNNPSELSVGLRYNF